MARPADPGRQRAPEPLRGAVRAHRTRRAARRLRPRRTLSLRTLDLRLLRLARGAGHTPARERAVARFSALGEHAAIWLALGAAGAALDTRRRPAWTRALGRVALAYAVNVAVKLVVRRERPQLDDLPPLVDTPTQLSFPSSHATSSFAAARLYAAVVPGAASPLYALAVALAASRVWLGVHHPSDVAAGAALGTVLAR